MSRKTTIKRTYRQKAATFFSVWKSNHNITLTALQNRYLGTRNSMRRTDIADLLRGFNQTKGNYQDTVATTRYKTKLKDKPRLGENFLILSSPVTKISDDENDDINAAKTAATKSFVAGLTIFNKHKKRYTAYQIQLSVYCMIETEKGDIKKDWISSNAFPLEIEFDFIDIWESFLKNLHKITQSVKGEIIYLATKTKLTFWHM